MRTVSRVTCVVLIASRKLKCSVMMSPYRQQMVAISWMCVSGEGTKASRADTAVGFVSPPLQVPRGAWRAVPECPGLAVVCGALLSWK